MLIVGAQNVTRDVGGERVLQVRGFSNYDVVVKINDLTIWKGKVEGHKRASGASVLLRRIAAEMDRDEK